MVRLTLTFVLAVGLVGCSSDAEPPMEVGSDITLQKADGVQVSGRIVEVQPEHVVVESPQGSRTTVRRAEIRQWQSLQLRQEAAPTSGDTKPQPSTAAADDRPAGTNPDEPRAATRPSEPAYREITVPAGTVLPLTLRTAVASDTSDVEDQVRATVRRAVTIDGVEVIPAGTALIGHITNAKRSAKVKGRGQVAFRFTQLDLPDERGPMNIRTATVARTAQGTKKRDAATIGGGAVGGAIIGGIIGGGDGAAKGAAIGGAAGTGAVLATRGEEVRLPAGTPVSARLTAPVTIRVPRQ